MHGSAKKLFALMAFGFVVNACSVMSVYASDQHQEYELTEDATGKFVQGITTQLTAAYADATADSRCFEIIPANRYVRVLGFKGDFYRIRGKNNELYVSKESMLLGDDLEEYVENSGYFRLQLLVIEDCVISGGDNAGAIGSAKAGDVFTGLCKFGSVYKIQYGSDYAYIPVDKVNSYYDIEYHEFSDVDMDELKQRTEELQELIGKYSRLLDEQQRAMIERGAQELQDGDYVYQHAEYDASVIQEMLKTDLSCTTDLRRGVVEYALQFVGNPYVWGGTSLTDGADCSGFCQSVLKHFGIGVSRVSYKQCYDGRAVNLDEVQPGDLLFYRRGSRIGHVVMYAGGGKVVQAKGKAYGICVTDLSTDGLVCIRNVID